MDSDLRKIKKYTKMMKKEGVLVIKTPEIEIHLSPQAVFHEESKPVETTTESVKEENPYTPDDALFWSTPGQIPQDEAVQ